MATAVLNVKIDSLNYMVTVYSENLIYYENRHADMVQLTYELGDSIVRLNKRTVMSEADFIKIFKYDRLYKYYTLCKRNTTQWKFYKGWSTRVFED